LTKVKENIDQLCINTIRTLSIDMINRAQSGHPGMPLGAAPMAYVLFTRHLRFNPKKPDWHDRDRFVLAGGHGSAMLYSMLHLCGYKLSMKDIKNFRQLDSITPGHPEFLLTPGVEATTGPLGQGEANAVGMAIAERALANRFNKSGLNIIGHYTYSIVTDGGLMEGVSAEAASLAGHLKLGKLIYLYDANDICLDGPISLTFSTENVAQRFKAYGWHVQTVKDGNTDIDAIDKAIIKAKEETSKPSLIIVKTTIGYGSPHKANTSSCHGSPLGKEETKLTKKELGWNYEKEFYIPQKVKAHFKKFEKKDIALYNKWQVMFNKYKKKYPELAKEWKRVWTRGIPADINKVFPKFKTGEMAGTRHASKKILNAVAAKMPEIIVGAGDVAMSTLAQLDGMGVFDGQSGEGRNIYYGVREHAMGAIANGVAYHGGILPFVSSYFTFTDYMRPAMRLAAMNNLNVFYIVTHDSIAVGEDGPTHQPVEHLMSLRAMPNMIVFRPADATETEQAWKWALANQNQPIAFVFTRQKLPVIDRQKFSSVRGVIKGAYVISDPPDCKAKAIIIATGSEVHIALDAQEILARKGIKTRVVSMPSWEIFEKQSAKYRENVLPSSIKARVSVEAGVTTGWEKWIGFDGAAVGVDEFGKSAPGDVLMKDFKITSGNVVSKVMKLLK